MNKEIISQKPDLLALAKQIAQVRNEAVKRRQASILCQSLIEKLRSGAK